MTTASSCNAADHSPPLAWRTPTRAAAETHALGRVLGRLAQAGTVALLRGELGSGKTVLAQGVGAGLDVPVVINSPSFVLVNEYLGGRLPLLHADLYRLTSAEEVAELALDEAAADGVLVLEWPERAPRALPPDHIEVRLESGPGPDDRLLQWSAQGPIAAALLDALRAAVAAGAAGDGR